MDYRFLEAGGQKENANAEGRGVRIAGGVPKFLPFYFVVVCLWFCVLLSRRASY